MEIDWHTCILENEAIVVDVNVKGKIEESGASDVKYSFRLICLNGRS